MKKIAWMKAVDNRPPVTDREMNLPIPLPDAETPPEILRQEREIESMVRSLIDNEGMQHSRNCITHPPGQETAAWRLIVCSLSLPSSAFAIYGLALAAVGSLSDGSSKLDSQDLRAIASQHALRPVSVDAMVGRLLR